MFRFRKTYGKLYYYMHGMQQDFSVIKVAIQVYQIWQDN